MGKSCLVQARLVAGHSVGAQDIFQQRTFLTDLQLAVTIGAFEIQVQINDEIADGLILELEFFAQDQEPAGAQTLVDAAQQRQTLARVDKLQGKVEHYH